MNTQIVKDFITCAFQEKPSVLIVSKNSSLQRKVLSSVMHWSGEIDIATNYEHAYDLVSISHYNIVIADFSTSEEDFIQFMKDIRSSNRPDFAGIKVLLLTNYDNPLMHILTKVSGIDDYLVKSVNMDELTSKVVNLALLPQN